MSKDAKIVFLSVFVLLMVGIVMIYSSSAVYAYGKYSNSEFFIKRHFLYLLVGIIAAVFCMSISVDAVSANSRKILLGVIILLTLVLIPGIGRQIGGARRWLRFMGFGFQPSELAKFALIIYLADLMTRKRHLIQDLRYGFLPPLVVTGLVGGLVLLEPDMGTFVSMLFIGGVMLYAQGAKFRHLLSLVLLVVPFLVFAIVTAPYRLKRILVFFHPWEDARGAGFQLIQSFIALGSGGFLGVGLGGSRQKLFYLPESHTDFIFSIIGEEMGFVGAAFVVVVFAALIWSLFRISFKIKDNFSSKVVFGITIIIAFEFIVNLGVSMGLLPTKGLPLPFISYGGSSLVCHLAAIGLVLNMSRRVE